MTKIKSCEECGKTPVVNAHFCLCYGCNQARLDANKPAKKEVIKKKQIKPIKQKTAKQAKIDKDILAAKNKKRELHIHNGTYYCEATGVAGEQLDISHIISIRRRPDLACELSNMRLMTRDAHNIWESRNIDEMSKLICFEEDKAYICKNDPEWYHLLFS